jgi:phosphate-selective porin OprO and OprP
MRLAVFVLTAGSLLAGVASAQESTQTAGPRALLGPIVQVEDAAPPAPTPAEASTPVTGKLLPGQRMEAAAPTAPAADAVVLQASWQNGVRLSSSDDQFHVHLGGLAQLDSTWLIGPHSVFLLPGDQMNGVGNSSATQLRRVRLVFDGDMYGMFDFVVSYDFANANDENSGLQPPSFGNIAGQPAPQDIWLQIRDVPLVGNIRIGYQTKPIGMTTNTSSSNLPFMERPDIYDAFYGPFDNGYVIGVSALDWNESERVTWQYGIFRPLTNVFGIGLNKYVGAARVTALPWYEEQGQELVHLGLGFLGGETVQEEFRARARPVLRNAPGFAVPIFVDTGDFTAGHQYSLGPEFALVLGPLTIQAEWAAQFLTETENSSNQPQGDLFFHGGYIEALWFLTGEHQEYLRRAGVFGPVIPRNSLRKGGSGCGAWQIGARFSYVDLDNKFIQGGRLYDWTFGLNWFLNANIAMQLNYIVEHRDQPGVVTGWINGIGLRTGYSF